MVTLVQTTKSDAMAAIRSFLLDILPPGVEVVNGLDNRVSEPTSLDFCTLTPISSVRLETNSTDFIDVFFQGSVSGTALTVSTVYLGTVKVGQKLFGENIPANTYITGTTTGGYTINKSLTLSSQPIASGYRVDNIPMQNTFQCDVHGPNSFNNSQIITGMYRSDWAVDTFANDSTSVSPLYCTDPRQAAFKNGEQQIEERWTLDLTVQCNNQIVVPQDYFDEAEVTGVVAVDVFYPA